MNQAALEHNRFSAEISVRYINLDEETVNRLIDANMTAAEYRLFLLLSLVDPFGNRSTPTSGSFLRERLGISKATYHRSIATITELDLFDIEDVVLRVRSKVGAKSPERIVSKMRPEFQERDDSLKNETSVAKMRITEAETVSSQCFQATSIDLNKDQSVSIEKEREKKPVLNQTQSEQQQIPSTDRPAQQQKVNKSPDRELKGWDWTEFSAPGADKEFFEFVVRRAAKFENPAPVDVKCTAEGWIRKQGHILWPEYLDWVERQNRQQWQTICEAPPPLPPQPTEAERRASALARLKAKYQNPRLRKAAIEECQRWGFAIGAAGPEETVIPKPSDLTKIES